ncbi:NYN domain-containing protein [Aquabacterium sp. J223]|uniref:NYN domain-containing protein n=1 Tax=Aquabacterium sp. J223 TaxID=2898431 RepID=UPI0021AE19E7|nr:NYN domain-containing protein [Aquabacterium sp. J223]UUX95150.1 NYN domain-containing protein [Aquabacterium sp. J223]
MSGLGQKLTRIGVFYDGNFFRLVSNHYLHSHPRQARISLAGLHHFVRHRVALEEGQDPRLCQVVDAHYFRGRLRAQEADERNLLLAERSFEDVLMREGITTHYLPMGPQGEKGIDVWLALEAFELALHKRFDVLVLIACDGDFVPLLRKLATLGTRTMLLGWNFTVSEPGRDDRETRTAQSLVDEATYPVLMHQLIDQQAGRGDALVDGLFLRGEPRPERSAVAEAPTADTAPWTQAACSAAWCRT